MAKNKKRIVLLDVQGVLAQVNSISLPSNLATKIASEPDDFNNILDTVKQVIREYAGCFDRIQNKFIVSEKLPAAERSGYEYNLWAKEFCRGIGLLKSSQDTPPQDILTEVLRDNFSQIGPYQHDNGAVPFAALAQMIKENKEDISFGLFSDAIPPYRGQTMAIAKESRLLRLLNKKALFFSCDDQMGVRKGDEGDEAFEKVEGYLKKLGYKPEQIGFIDDNDCNCQKAFERGWKVVHFGHGVHSITEAVHHLKCAFGGPQF
jgi:hypothetical protein